MLLKGKRVIVTGGLTGVGKASVCSMVREGASVVSVSRPAPDSARAIAVVEKAKSLGEGKVAHMALDVTKQADVNRVIDEAVAFLGGLDVLVNSAGVEQQKPTEDLTEQDLHEMFSVNMFGTAYTCAAAFRHLKMSGGTIINYSSYAGVSGIPMMAAYGAAKGAVLTYTRVIAKEWAPYLIRAHAICPGVMTEMSEVWYAEMSPERRIEIEAFKKASIPLTGDLGKPEDAANLNIFLASDLACYMTGQLIGVDGGMMMGR